MALFGLDKKKDEGNITSCCCCGMFETSDVSENCCGGFQNTAETCSAEVTNGICCIKVLGAGCKSCHEQYENVKKAVSEVDIDIEVEYITDMEKGMAYSVMSMPAIVVNENVVAMGKVLKTADVVKLLKKFTE